MDRISNKKVREIVFSKYDGKCAYCGCDLEKGWHIDHIKSLANGGKNDLENFNPSCKSCNSYKSHNNLEEYRRQLNKMLNENIEYLFKSKTKMNVAINMGTVEYKKWDFKFYFEKYGK